MLHRSRLRIASSGLAALALATGGVVATAAPAVGAADGPAAHFVVLGPTGNLAGTERSIQQADGEILVSWPQIGSSW